MWKKIMSKQREIETKIVSYLILVVWLASARDSCAKYKLQSESCTEIKIIRILICRSSFHLLGCRRSNSTVILILKHH